jgi:hypothetical protein
MPLYQKVGMGHVVENSLRGAEEIPNDVVDVYGQPYLRQALLVCIQHGKHIGVKLVCSTHSPGPNAQLGDDGAPGRMLDH